MDSQLLLNLIKLCTEGFSTLSQRITEVEEALRRPPAGGRISKGQAAALAETREIAEFARDSMMELIQELALTGALSPVWLTQRGLDGLLPGNSQPPHAANPSEAESKFLLPDPSNPFRQ